MKKVNDYAVRNKLKDCHGVKPKDLKLGLCSVLDFLCLGRHSFGMWFSKLLCASAFMNKDRHANFFNIFIFKIVMCNKGGHGR